jgi:hypothetical protein
MQGGAAANFKNAQNVIELPNEKKHAASPTGLPSSAERSIHP